MGIKMKTTQMTSANDIRPSTSTTRKNKNDFLSNLPNQAINI